MQLVQSLDLYFPTNPQGGEAGTTTSPTTAQFAHEVTTFPFSLLISLEFANYTFRRTRSSSLSTNFGRSGAVSIQRSATIWQISEPVAYNVRTIIGFCCPCYCSPLADAIFFFCNLLYTPVAWRRTGTPPSQNAKESRKDRSGVPLCFKLRHYLLENEDKFWGGGGRRIDYYSLLPQKSGALKGGPIRQQHQNSIEFQTTEGGNRILSTSYLLPESDSLRPSKKSKVGSRKSEVGRNVREHTQSITFIEHKKKKVPSRFSYVQYSTSFELSAPLPCLSQSPRAVRTNTSLSQSKLSHFTVLYP